MRKGRRIAWLGIIALALFFSVQVSGCSVIGLIVGFTVDQGVPKVRVIPPHHALQISPGARVAFHLKDGTTVTGLYQGVGRIPESDYARHYRSWLDSLPFGERYPALGDSIQVNKRSGVILATTFAGFSYRRVMFDSAAEARTGGVQFEDLVSISGPDGRAIEASTLVTRDVSGDLPSRSALRVGTPGDTTLVAMDQIVDVETPTVRHAARNGFLIGLVADVIVVAIAAATYEPSSSSSGSGCEGSSGPSFDVGVQPLEAPFDIWAGRPVTIPEETAEARNEAPALSTRDDPRNSVAQP